MSNLKNILRDVGYFGVGAAAALVEAGGKAVKVLVRKGEKTLRDNQDTVDELKRKTRELGEMVKSSVEKATNRPAPEEPAQSDPEEQTEPLGQPAEADLTDVQPVTPDAVYRTEAPLPEEDAIPAEAALPADAPIPEEAGSAADEATPDAPIEEPASSGETPVLVIPEEEHPTDPFTRY